MDYHVAIEYTGPPSLDSLASLEPPLLLIYLILTIFNLLYISIIHSNLSDHSNYIEKVSLSIRTLL